MAAVKAVLGVVNEAEFLEEVRFKGRVLRNALEVLAERVPGAEVRGEGLLVGLDLGPELAPKVFERCLEEGVLVNLIGGTTIRMAPPLTVTKMEVRAALDTFRGCIDAMTNDSSSRRSEMPEAAVA
jgi:acetylornithine/succinyldiaminopimelate/putrescine aminotransferase